MDLEFNVTGGDFTNAGTASSELKKTLKKLNVDPKITRKVVIAMYEAEVNIVAHAYKGTIHIQISPEQIQVTLKDEGPGIPDIEKAMQEGFSTASAKVREMGFGAGMGLPNIKKNTDSLEINSEPGQGTELTFTKNLISLS